jgi:4-hydroxy-tetrahydrodipicolinate synthase
VPKPLGQLITPMATPFDEAGAVDLKVAASLARHLVETGSDGIAVFATTGEGPMLSDAEKLALLETVIDVAGASASIVANTGTYNTHHSVELTRRALRTGVDAFMVVTPYYVKPPPAGIVAHFERLAEAADGRPVVVYNIPQRVVVNLPPELLERLGQIENVVAVKQATPDLDQARRIVEHTGLALYAGNDDLLMPFLELGGAGGVCVASHVAGPAMREMIERARSGDLDGARAIDAALRPLLAALAVTTNPIPVKAALELLGLAPARVRLPLVEATEEERVTIRAALATIPTPTAAA